MKLRIRFQNEVSYMRYLLSVTIAAGLASTALAQTFYNDVDYEIPPQQGVIDAVTFFNDTGGFFLVTNPPSTASGEALPYTTSDTLNYTNRGRIIANPGFDFKYFPSSPPPPQPGIPFSDMSANFANINNGLGGGSIECSGIGLTTTAGFTFEVLNNPEIVVHAQNIVDSGLNTMDELGLMDFRGNDLDMRRGEFIMTNSLGSAGHTDIDWGSGGVGTNSFGMDPFFQLTPTTASSPEFLSTPNFAIEQMSLTNATVYFQSDTGVGTGSGTVVWRIIYIQDSSPANVTNHVYFTTFPFGGEFNVEWTGTVHDPVTGAIFTNYLYLSDEPANRQSTNFSFTTAPDTAYQFFGDFTLASSTAKLIQTAPTPPSFVETPFTNTVVSNDFSYINAFVSAASATNGVLYSVTNVLGRLQLTASQSLKLANTRVAGPNYLLLSAPNDFEGNTNSLISVPFADLNLGVPGGLLAISNLLNPNVPTSWNGITNAPSAVFDEDFIPPVPTPMGGIQAFSLRYTFQGSNAANTATVTNDVRVLLVNSAVQPTSPAFQQDVKLHTGNDLVVSDTLNVYRNFLSDAQVLTITTNGPGAFSLAGQINFLSPNILWSTSLPNLEIFTNSGVFTSGNLTVFAGNVSNPYSDLGAATPYQAFINYGAITNGGGTFIRTGAFENTGVIDDSPNGRIDIVASGNAIATNGSFIAPEGSVSISANSLIASNGVIIAGGGPLTLNTPCSLADGYVLNNQFGEVTNSTFPYIVTNGNTWVTSGGINIPVMAPSGDNLLATTITNLAFNGFSINLGTSWPGNDLGVNPQGFGDNLAVGRMILNADPISVLNFLPATANNALYVDSIELQGNTTNTDANGNHLSIAIQPGMNIYYAQALENGVSIAEKLNGKTGGDPSQPANGGHFYWVSNYAGVYSSTNIFYNSDGNTYIFNEALAISPDIASGGPGAPPGTANINNPEPIPTNETFVININPPTVCDPPVINPGNPGGTNSPPGLQTNLTGLALPPVQSPTNGGVGGAGVSFSVAQGSYDGLFYETNDVNPSTAGSFTAKITSKGNYSAKLQLGKSIYSFSGVFDSSGHAERAISGKKLAMLSVDLQLNNNDQIIGSVAGDGWLAQLEANRAAAVSNPAWLGKKTLLLPSDSQYSTTNTGEGYGTANISANGSAQWSGVLPDGVKLSGKSALAADGTWPVYSSLYGGSGVFIGWMQFTNHPGSDISGTDVWVMPPGRGLYPPGLTNRVDAVGSSVLGTVGSAHLAVVLSGAALDQSLTNTVTIFGKTIEGSNHAWKMSVNPQTGLFNGSVTEPDGGQKLSFQGAFLERSGTGGGFFLNADQSGKVYFGPAN